jgi:hypothetical protein
VDRYERAWEMMREMSHTSPKAWHDIGPIMKDHLKEFADAYLALVNGPTVIK